MKTTLRHHGVLALVALSLGFHLGCTGSDPINPGYYRTNVVYGLSGDDGGYPCVFLNIRSMTARPLDPGIIDQIGATEINLKETSPLTWDFNPSGDCINPGGAQPSATLPEGLWELTDVTVDAVALRAANGNIQVGAGVGCQTPEPRNVLINHPGPLVFEVGPNAAPVQLLLDVAGIEAGIGDCDQLLQNFGSIIQLTQ
jgi:hypothetical protein